MEGVPNGFGISFVLDWGCIMEGYFDNGEPSGYANVIAKNGKEIFTGKVLTVEGKDIFVTKNKNLHEKVRKFIRLDLCITLVKNHRLKSLFTLTTLS